jgi:hypothetical protein
MTPEARAGLQALAYALPPGSAVAVPREWLLELLNHSGVTHEQSGARRDADFTVVDPVASLEAFEARHREAGEPRREAGGMSTVANLSVWRKAS